MLPALPIESRRPLHGMEPLAWRGASRVLSGPREHEAPDPSSQRNREVSPLFCIRAVGEQADNALDDRTELVVAERPDQDAARVVAVGFSPFSEQRREVSGVARHEDALFSGGKFEHLGIVQGTEDGVRCQVQHVVVASLEGGADALGRQVGIEEQAHPQALATSMNGNRMPTSVTGRRLSAIDASISSGYASR